MQKKYCRIPLISLAFSIGIASPTPYATEAGLKILKKGGSAVDAAIASAFALNVAVPYKMGIGGGGFMLIGEKNGRITAINHRETAPASAHEKMFLDDLGKPLRFDPERITGPNPIGVPGTLAGFALAHQRWGKLPWKTLLQPAIELAENGVTVSKYFSKDLQDHKSRLELFAASKAAFSRGGDGMLERGEILRQPMLAKTLREIAKSGAGAFYRGALARSWLAEARKLGVKISEEDLRNYKAEASPAIHYPVFGKQGHTPDVPSSSAAIVGGTLRFLERHYQRNALPRPDSAERYVASLEALAYFQELRTRTVADQGFATLDFRKYFGSAEEKAAWAEIEKRIAARKARLGTRVTGHGFPAKERRALANGGQRLPEYGSTAQISVFDGDEMAVSLTNTIEEYFGSAIMVPGHGFLLNNELTDFDAEPGKPNSPAPGKRPRSNMSPTLLYDGKALIGVLGGSGGLRIPTGVALFLENYFIFKMDAKQAIAAPRIHPIQPGTESYKVEVESGMPRQTVEALREAGYAIDEQEIVFTLSEMLIRREKTAPWEAAADPRYDGMGVVY